MIISSWNVNSVRARIDNIKDYLTNFSPDIFLMQEIKTEDINFPYEEFKKFNYQSYVFGQKSYNGVAILSKNKLENIRTNLINDKLKQSRIISGEFTHKKRNIQIINIYTPNGNPVDTEKYSYKKEWLDTLVKNLKNAQKVTAGSTIDKDRVYFPLYEPTTVANVCKTGKAILGQYDTKCGTSTIFTLGTGVLSKVVVQGDKLYIGISGEAEDKGKFTSKDNLITAESDAEGDGAIKLEGWKENY